MKGKVSLVAFPVLLYSTLLEHFNVPKFAMLCNGMALTPEEDDTCFGMARNTAHTECYNRSLLMELGTFIAQYWATLWSVTMSHLMPLLDSSYATALTKASISLSIIPVCIFHSCLESRESIPPHRSALLWQGNDAELFLLQSHHTTSLSLFPAKNCSQCRLNKPAPHNTARYQPQTPHRFDCKRFLESMSRTNSLRNLTTVF